MPGSIAKWFLRNSLDRLTTDFLAGLTGTQPTPEHIRLIDVFIKTVRPIITTKADVMYLGNINDSNDSYRNLVKNAHHGIKASSGLVWDPYWGYSNPAGTGYVNTNYNPSTQKSKLALNDISAGIYLDYTHTLNQLSFGATTGANYAIGLRQNGDAINDNWALNISGALTPILPFKKGLRVARKTSSSAFVGINQNISNYLLTVITTGIPNADIYLFRLNGSVTNYYTGGLNFFYLGAALTDAEYITLNNAYNDYLIQCLFLKYGASNWGVQMAQSYFLNLHNHEKYEAWEVYEFIKRMQPTYVDSAGTGYYFNTFGPLGQNKTVADFIMLFKAGGNLATNVWTKTGATLRWDMSGTITDSNTMPAYTRGTNMGIITLTSTDGWNGVTVFSINQTAASVNSFYGNLPKLFKLKTGGSKAALVGINNRFKYDFRGDPIATLLNGFRMAVISYPGYERVNLSDFLGGTYSTYISVYGDFNNSQNILTGNMSDFTNEFRQVTTNQILIAQSLQVTGTLSNIIFNSTIQTINFSRTNITAGFTSWSTSILSCTLTDNAFPTAAVNAQLAFLNTFYGANTPIKNLTLKLEGATMGIPTGGASNTDLLGIVAKHVAAGFTATITVRTS